MNFYGIQDSLASNTWIIHTNNGSNQITDYFGDLPLRIGLNAKIFFVKSTSEIKFESFGPSTTEITNITQILGTGTYNVQLQNLDLVTEESLHKILENTESRSVLPTFSNIFPNLKYQSWQH